MSLQIISGTFASDVANNGTVVVAYPSGLTPGHFAASVAHALAVGQSLLNYPTKFTLTFGAVGTGITVTNKSGSTWTAGTAYILELEVIGEISYTNDSTGFSPANSTHAILLEAQLGAPAAASSTFLAASQGIAANAAAVLAATVLDVPRNVVAAWTTSAKITVTGTDVYGAVLTEGNASAATSFTGAKAFKTITSIVSDTAITGFTAGTGTVLGLPFFIPSSGHVIARLENGAAVTTGTLTAGVFTAASSSTTGDVRGTWAPNTAPNGSNNYTVIAAVPDPGYRGQAQA